MDEHNATTDGMPLPLAWQKALAGARIERQSMGVSRADVARVLRPGRPDAFLKSELIDAFSSWAMRSHACAGSRHRDNRRQR